MKVEPILTITNISNLINLLYIMANNKISFTGNSTSFLNFKLQSDGGSMFLKRTQIDWSKRNYRSMWYWVIKKKDSLLIKDISLDFY